MTYADYWERPIHLFWDYVRAGLIKRKQEDFAAWAQGYYIRQAFADVITPIFAAKGSKPERIYPDAPVFTKDEAKENSRKKRKPRAKATSAEEERRAEIAAIIRARFEALNAATNAPFLDNDRE